MNKNKLNNNVIINDKIEFNLTEFNDVNKIVKNSSELFKNLYSDANLELKYKKNGNILIINKIIIRNINEKDLNVLRNRVIKAIRNAINYDIKRKYEENPELYYKYLKESILLNLYNGIGDLEDNIKNFDVEEIEYEAGHLVRFIHYSLSENLTKFQDILDKKLNVVFDENVTKQKIDIKDEFDNIFFEIKRSEDKLDFLLNYLGNYKKETDKNMIKNVFDEVKKLDETIENSLDNIYMNYLKIENTLLKKELEELKKKLNNKQEETKKIKQKLKTNLN